MKCLKNDYWLNIFSISFLKDIVKHSSDLAHFCSFSISNNVVKMANNGFAARNHRNVLFVVKSVVEKYFNESSVD